MAYKITLSFIRCAKASQEKHAVSKYSLLLKMFCYGLFLAIQASVILYFMAVADIFKGWIFFRILDLELKRCINKKDQTFSISFVKNVHIMAHVLSGQLQRMKQGPHFSLAALSDKRKNNNNKVQNQSAKGPNFMS